MAIERMKPRYSVEVGDNRVPATCRCCGRNSSTAHGFVYKDGDAYAVYYASWSEEHPEPHLFLALAVGEEWDDEASSSSRTCFGLVAREEGEQVLFRVTGPEESPWPNSDVLGPMLSRDAALRHSLLPEVFAIAERVLRWHPALREYLSLSEDSDVELM